MSEAGIIIIVVLAFMTMGYYGGKREIPSRLRCTEQRPIENTYPVENECVAWKLKEIE